MQGDHGVWLSLFQFSQTVVANLKNGSLRITHVTNYACQQEVGINVFYQGGSFVFGARIIQCDLKFAIWSLPIALAGCDQHQPARPSFVRPGGMALLPCPFLRVSSRWCRAGLKMSSILGGPRRNNTFIDDFALTTAFYMGFHVSWWVTLWQQAAS